MKEIEISKKIGRELLDEDVLPLAAKALGCKPQMVGEWRVVRRSVDARKEPLYRYRVAVVRKGEDFEEYVTEPYLDVASAEPVLIVGAGPAGMFAALKLLTRGYKPVILERGKDVHARKFDIARLSREGLVDTDSNYCFGEGGAGTFSDGKLFTRSSKRGDIREVLHQLVQFGADPDILVSAHPHIGSDKLPQIVENIRKCIVGHGGEYHFGCRVEDIVRKADGSYELKAPCGSFSARKVILACGHSARDIYRLFVSRGWAVEAKGFALGVRVEHPQWLINKIQYHGKWQPFMPTAEYAFVTQIEGRGVFSFCMCPGGILVPSSTEPGELVLNGMSNSARNSKWANAGVVVSVEPEDLPHYQKYGPLSSLEFQRDVERSMFDFSSSFKAPAQRMMDFCRRVPSANLPASSYHPGTVPAPLHELLPENISLRLKYAFPYVGNKLMHGYYTNEALLLGVESRTSSPVRLPRDPQTLEHVDLPGLYPCGEGAGYSGGIVSSALDGIRCAEQV
ncbi:MAG: NAD(P)/FAD-dependent oxidoreductase [Candidatus Cryptobacteroides sp.]|nr:NAD(P)/FAD-dependent oxidoreductase [Bacteroidales bacterium]MDY2707479.1 NAD(P)/FAD-dependent oxidoreductase [Candidatus Cryptobacteroides sp.]MCI7750040.1 NAD(P)/FAD-dependent oxidoreductase [Bacteroidales bacterium]MDD7531395.1 NAD(P)/FAD-dependent oxidoreductase [Bacteroidales bacterium]MDY2858019.1 NAD(P)/FAD-dependent oxidoreductase [Candidatus Cryptobacteroides sp.]